MTLSGKVDKFCDEWANNHVNNPSVREDMLTLLQSVAAASRAEALSESRPIQDAAEFMWLVLANVSEGDWTKQNKAWQEAVVKARDGYFQTIQSLPPREAQSKVNP